MLMRDLVVCMYSRRWYEYPSYAMLTYYDDAMIQCTTCNTYIPGMTIMLGLGNNSIRIAAVLCSR